MDKILTILLLVVITSASVLAQTQNKADITKKRTVRLYPKDFSQLPQPIVAYLEEKKCTIPQSYAVKTPHNVLEGEFFRRGQKDWAVLCSNNGVSKILVFRESKTDTVDELGQERDNTFLQTIDKMGNTGYSRLIKVVTPALVENKNDKLPQVDHVGIEDAFYEKASDIFYFYGRRWVRLKGAD